jgi:hypothetical protein
VARRAQRIRNLDIRTGRKRPIVSSGSQGWPRFSRPPEGLVLDGREHDGTLAVSERKTTMRGSGARLVTTTIVAASRVPVPAISTEVRELQSGSPSIISISRPSNWLLLLREHNFGSFTLDGRKLFWKIDYYDAACEYGSEDPARSFASWTTACTGCNAARAPRHRP